MTIESIRLGPVRLTVDIRGEGVPLVLVPSLGIGAEEYEPVIPLLNGRGYRTIAVNPRGIAGSEGPLDGITLHHLAGDIAGIVEFFNIAPAHIVGHAFGNRVARCLAADYPPFVRTVTLIAAGGTVPPDDEARAALQRLMSGELEGADKLEALRICMFSPNSDAAAWQDIGIWAETARAQSAASRTTPVEQWWHAGQARLLVIQGLDDRIAPPGNGHAIAEGLAGRAEVVDLPDAGHALLPEQPEAIVAVMDSFLSSD